MDSSTPVDRIQVEIIADSNEAIRNIESFATSLRNLQSLGSENNNYLPDISSKSTSGLSDLISQLKTLNTFDLSNFISQITEAGRAIDRLGNKGGGLDLFSNSNDWFSQPHFFSGQQSSSQPSQLAPLNLAEQMNNWQPIPNVPKNDVKTPEQTGQDISSFLNNVTDSFKQIDGLKSGLMVGLTALAPEVGAVVSAIEPVISNVFGGITSAASNAFSVVGSVARPAFDTIMSGLNQIGKLGVSVFAKIGSSILQLSISPFTLLGNAITGVVSKMWSLLASFIRIAKFRIIRTIIKELTTGLKEGVNNAYQYSKALNGSFSKSLDKIATSSLYVKNSLGAMVMPLIQVAAPIIESFADKFVEVLNFINENLAKAFGQSTWTKAVKVPTEFAEATEDATKANEKLKRSILSFDEIHALKDNSKSDSTSTSTATDYSSMFKQEKVDIDNLFDVDWNKIQAKAVKFANKLGNTFNSFVKKANWKKIGSTIAQMFNTVVLATDALVTKIKWGKLGKAISTSFNSFVSTFQWSKLGKTLADVVNIIPAFMGNASYTFNWSKFGKKLTESLNSFVKNINVMGIANALALTIKGVCTTATEVFTSPSWEALGVKLRDGLISFFNSNPLLALGDTIRGAFYGIFSFAVGLFGKNNDGISVANALGNDLAKGINSWFKDEKWWKKAKISVYSVVGGLYNFLKTSIFKIDIVSIADKLSRTINKVCKMAVAMFSFGWKELGEKIRDGLITFFNNKPFNAVSNAIQTALSAVFDLVIGLFSSNKKGESIAESLGKDLGSAINTWFKDESWWKKAGIALSEIVSAVSDFISSAMDELDYVQITKALSTFLTGLDWTKIISKIFKVVARVVGATNFIHMLGKSVGDTFMSGILSADFTKVSAGVSKQFGEGLTSNLLKVLKAGKKVATNFINGITSGDYLRTAFNIIGDLDKGLTQNTRKIFNKAVEIKDEIFKGLNVSSFFELGVKILSKIIGGIKDGIVNLPKLALSIVNKIKNAIKNNLGVIFEQGKKLGENVLKGVAEGLTFIWNHLDNKWINLLKKFIKIPFDKFEVHSPSRLFKRLGIRVIQGLQVGIENYANPLLKSAKNIVNKVTGVFNNGSYDIVSQAEYSMVGNTMSNYAVSVDDTATQFAMDMSGNYAEQNALLREQNNLLLKIYEKSGENSVGIRTSDVIQAFARKNTREGKTVVPLGV